MLKDNILENKGDETPDIINDDELELEDNKAVEPPKIEEKKQKEKKPRKKRVYKRQTSNDEELNKIKGEALARGRAKLLQKVHKYNELESKYNATAEEKERLNIELVKAQAKLEAIMGLNQNQQPTQQPTQQIHQPQEKPKYNNFKTKFNF
jgi:hypothetical protein